MIFHLVSASRLPGKLTEECHCILWRLLNYAMAHIEYVLAWACLLETSGDLSLYNILQQQTGVVLQPSTVQGHGQP